MKKIARRTLFSSRRPTTGSSLLMILGSSSLVYAGCADEITNNYITNEYGDQGGAGGGGAGGEAPDFEPEAYPGAPTADTAVEDQAVNVFGVVGNEYWFAVADEQLEELNVNSGQGGPIFFAQPGDFYSPGGESEGNYSDHLWITTAGSPSETADYGKVRLKIVGQSTMRPWNESSLPNLNLDANDFVEGQRISGYEHLRFNNGQVGSIFRERLTLQLYAAMGYPAPQATYAWVSSNVWGADIKVPYVLVERYKRPFCEKWSEELGGGCANIWEFAGDFAQNVVFGGGEVLEGDGVPLMRGEPVVGVGPSVFDDLSACEFNECDDASAREFEALVQQTPPGPGFKETLKESLHWPSFHRFQCLSWVLATGDDALHNMNNVVLVERGDGLFMYLPYSVDISLGQEWYPTVPLAGQNSIARGCQSDEECWSDMVAVCEDVVAEFEELEPNELLDDIYATLTNEGMIRAGDEQRYTQLVAWFENRLASLPSELDDNREPPLICDFGQIDCGGYCDYFENCENNCNPGEGLPGEGGLGGAGGADDGGAVECPLIKVYSIE
jgi:hypothetical protein